MAIEETNVATTPQSSSDAAVASAAQVFQRGLDQEEGKGPPERLKQGRDELLEPAGGDDLPDPPVRTQQTQQAPRRAQPAQQTEETDDEPEIRDFQPGADDEVDPITEAETLQQLDGTQVAGDDGIQIPEEALDAPVRVIVQGKHFAVPLREVVASYQQQKFISEKGYRLNQQRDAFQEHVQAVVQERSAYTQALGELQTEIAKIKQLGTPDWETLKRTDPQTYINLQQEFQRLEALDQAAKREAQTAAQLQAQHSAREFQQTRSRESERLSQRVPAFADPVRSAQLSKDIQQFGVQEGFSVDELNSVVDHRMVVTLYKAMLYDRQRRASARVQPARDGTPAPRVNGNGLMNAAVAARQAAPTTGNRIPGRQNTRSRDQSELTTANKRLAKSGSMDAAKGFFQQFLKNEG